jgi:hypothetical protein
MSKKSKRQTAKPEKVSIAQLEAILNDEEETAIEILPNGTIKRSKKEHVPRKPLTMRENLGGEYAIA